MLIQNTKNSYNKSILHPTFKAIKLQEEEKKEAENLYNKLTNLKNKQDNNLIKDKIFNIFEPHIKKESYIKIASHNERNDFIQKLYLVFFESLDKFKNSKKPLDELITELNKTKPDCGGYFQNQEYSISNKIRTDSNTTFEEILTDKQLPIYISSPSKDEKRTAERKFAKLDSTFDLTEREHEALRLRSKGKVYKQIAKKMDVSRQRSSQIVRKSIAKIQMQNNITPEEILVQAKKFQESFNQNFDTATKLIINALPLKDVDLNKVENNIQTIAKELNINSQEYFNSTIQTPNLLLLNPKTIIDNIKTLSKKLEIPHENYAKACLKQPSLFSMKPDTIVEKVHQTSKRLGINSKEYSEMALNSPPLFFQRPETIVKNINEASHILNIPVKKYVHSCLKHPTLFSMKAESINSNIEEIINHFGFDRKKFIKSGLRQSHIFYQKPKSLIKNVSSVAKTLSVSEEQYANACLKQPSLFIMKSDTVKSNIANTAKLLEISVDKAIQIALSQPQLFLQKPETIYKNVMNYCQLLNISKQEFMQIAIKSPALLYQKAETNLQHIKESSKILNIPETEILNYSLTMPNLFSLNPQTLKEKVDIALLYRAICGKSSEDILKSVRTIKNEDYFDIMIKRILRKQAKIILENKNLHQNIIEYFTQNNLKKFNIELPNNSMTKSFIEYTNKIIKEACGKTLFKFSEPVIKKIL